MFEKKDNPRIFRMETYKDDALRGGYRNVPCADEIKPLIKAFFRKCMNTKVKWNEDSITCVRIESISEIMKNLALNTRNYEKLTSEDFASLKKICDELDELYAEVLNHYSQSKRDDNLCVKINCISEIMCKNKAHMHDSQEEHEDYRDGMIFQSYENLWKVIHRINTEWNELCSRGFSLKVFYDFYTSFGYNRSIHKENTEEEKLKTFMALLDGKKKFVPIYEVKPVCFDIVDNDFNGEVIYKTQNRYSTPYRMSQHDEEIQ